MVSILSCKRRQFSFTLQRYDVFESSAKKISKNQVVCAQNHQKRGWIPKSTPKFVMLG